MTKTVTGIALIVLGIVAGIYFGFIWAFIGGIISIIHGLQASPMSATMIAWGIARVFFAGLIGWLAAFSFIIPGAGLMASD